MKLLLAFGLLILSGSGFAANRLDPNQALVRSLAERPIGVVIGDKCEIRGAVWADGPRAGVKSALVNVQTGETFFVMTNAQGVYSASIPYAGKPMVFQERVVSDLIYPANTSVHIKDGGAVCDHRLTNNQLNKEAK